MTADALYCFESEPVNTVAQKMADWWVRRLPVVNRDKRLIGVVSFADLANPQTGPEPTQAARHSTTPRSSTAWCGRPGRSARLQLRPK